ncbi:MAG: type II secretion system F family protein [Candidatus Methanomethyliaceae archaeon]
MGEAIYFMLAYQQECILVGLLTFGAVTLTTISLAKRAATKRSYLAEAIAPSVEQLQEAAELAIIEKQILEKSEREEVKLPWLWRLEEEAAKAGIKTTAYNLLVIALVGSAGIFTAIYVILGSWQVAVVGSLLGLIAPHWWIQRQKAARAAAFAKGLDGALMLAASTLRAGASLSQALEKVSKESTEPVATEFKRLDAAIKAGMTPTQAIATLRERVDSPEVNMFIAGSEILFQTGGNLAEVYENIAQSIRQHRNFRQAVIAYTAQARMSAVVVTLVPIGVTAFVRMLNPDYFTPMLKSPMGSILFYGSYAAIAVGWAIIQRMINVAMD